MRKLLKDTLRALCPKCGYVMWLASSEGPSPQPFLHRFRAPWHVRLAHALLRSPKRADHLNIPPSQRVKARAIRAHARRLGIRIFVETGTFKGETVAAVADAFARRVTVEISPELWREASAALPDVQCMLGDSGEVLKTIVPALDGPALFWLDAHSSGGNTIDSGVGPILDEMRTIFASPYPHVVLIDDARGHNVEAIKAASGNRSFVVRNDIIRITPT